MMMTKTMTISSPRGSARAINAQGQLLDHQGRPILTRNLNAAPVALRSHSDPIREHFVNTDKGFKVVTEQTCDDTIKAVHDAGSLLRKRTKGDGARYMGSAPLVVVQIWAKECGAKPGTREFLEYARRKLTDGEYARLKVHMA
jgi:hypothetical protein